jgi:hypothetical protein
MNKAWHAAELLKICAAALHGSMALHRSTLEGAIEFAEVIQVMADKLEKRANERVELIISIVWCDQPQVQRQDATDAQLQDLVRLAEQHGMYDAADYVKRMIGGVS